MMHSIRLFGLAFAAILAMCAVSATSASATEESAIFSKTGTFSGKATKETDLEISNGDKVECPSATTKGEITSEDHGLELVLLEKCFTTKIIHIPCTSPGAPSEEILIPHLLILLGSDKNPATEENPAVLLEPSPDTVDFTCEAAGLKAEISVSGSVICLAKNNGAKTAVELLCEKSSKTGEEKDKHFWDSSEEDVEDQLLTTGEGAEKFTKLESAQIGTTTLEGSEIQIAEKQTITIKPIESTEKNKKCPKENAGKAVFEKLNEWCEYEVKNENPKEEVKIVEEFIGVKGECIIGAELCLRLEKPTGKPECDRGLGLAAKGGQCYARLEYIKKPTTLEAETRYRVETKSVPNNATAKPEVGQIVK